MRLFSRTVLALALIGGLVSGCATREGLDPRSANTATRTIALHHPDSGESVSVTYLRQGAYDPHALEAVNALFRDRRTGEVVTIDPALIDLLADLRDRLGVPADTAIHLTSGYRSPLTNASLSRTNANVAENSYHIRGQAADIRIPGVALDRIAAEAAAMRRGGYALYTAHVHVDTGPFRTWSTLGNGRERRTWTEARSTARTRTLALRTPPKTPPAKAVAQAKARTRVVQAPPPPRPPLVVADAAARDEKPARKPVRN